MKLCIRAHDLGVTGTGGILNRLDRLGLDGVQLVCYKAFDDIPYAPGAITGERAGQIGRAFAASGKAVPYVGAYFNPVHEDPRKVERCAAVFADYLRHCKALGADTVGSETGSYNNDSWTYHPMNRTEEALQRVVAVFSRLCDIAGDCGSTVALEGCCEHVCWDVDTLARARKMLGRRTKVVFDLYNFLSEENQGDYLKVLDRGLEAFAGDILLFHLKDCFLANGRRPIQTPFGQGGLDLEAVLGRIKAYDPNAVLVLEETTDPHIEYAVQTVNRIWAGV